MQTVETERAVDPIDSEGMIRGTKTEAYRIAALLGGGMRVDDVLRDYRGLTETQVAAAVDYAKRYPNQGRPYPTRTVKSVLRRGAGGLAKAFSAANEE